MLQNIMHGLTVTIVLRTERRTLVGCNLLARNLKACLGHFFSGQIQLYFLIPSCEPTFIQVLVSTEVVKAYIPKSKASLSQLKQSLSLQ